MTNPEQETFAAKGSASGDVGKSFVIPIPLGNNQTARIMVPDQLSREGWDKVLAILGAYRLLSEARTDSQN